MLRKAEKAVVEEKGFAGGDEPQVQPERDDRSMSLKSGGEPMETEEENSSQKKSGKNDKQPE